MSYIVTGVLLLVLAMLLYKFELDEKTVSAGIVAIYVASTLIGGLVLGKMAKVRMFFVGTGSWYCIFCPAAFDYTGGIPYVRRKWNKCDDCICPLLREEE